MKKATLSVLAALLLASGAFAQETPPVSCPPFATSVFKNCTTETCVFEACWTTAQPMSTCNLLISSTAGALPPVVGTVNTTKDVCTVSTPKLPQGTYTLTIVGTNQYGNGPQTTAKMTLQTGAVPTSAASVVPK